MNTQRRDFIEALESLIHKDSTCSDIVIDYGYWDHQAKFHKSDVDINMDKDKSECVHIYYFGNENFGTYQSIEMDGYLWIMKDIIKGIERL